MAWNIILAILTSLISIVGLVWVVYESVENDNNVGWTGFITGPLIVLAVTLWSVVVEYHSPVLNTTIEDVVSYQIDTTFIVRPDKVDTLYTINYGKVNTNSRDYEKSK